MSLNYLRSIRILKIRLFTVWSVFLLYCCFFGWQGRRHNTLFPTVFGVILVQLNEWIPVLLMHGSSLPVTIPPPGNPGDKSSPLDPGVGNCLKPSCPGGRGAGQIENKKYVTCRFTPDRVEKTAYFQGTISARDRKRKCCTCT